MEVTTAMYFKLAIKNVRKSVKDFTIYFLTLAFGVCLFYVFNSIESQQSMLDISESQHELLEIMTQTLGYVSVFITFVLGFLIIYANNFLIRRRKKELGLYMTLGMDRSKISRILIAETFLIGVVALAVRNQYRGQQSFCIIQQISDFLIRRMFPLFNRIQIGRRE